MARCLHEACGAAVELRKALDRDVALELSPAGAELGCDALVLDRPDHDEL